MDKKNYSTERRKGQHLQREERGAIQHLIKLGYTKRAIARELGCSPTTVANELKRGTRAKNGIRGRNPSYSAKLGERTYRENRKQSKRKHKMERCPGFVMRMIQQFKEKKWSLDSCVGYAKKKGLFPEEKIVCTHTLYNEVRAGNLGIAVIDLPKAAKRKRRSCKSEKSVRENKRKYGKSITERPEIANQKLEIGHWEGDTVVGKRSGHEEVILTLVEKKTRYYYAIRIAGKDTQSVLAAMWNFRKAFGAKFANVFKTITYDNGAEFSGVSAIEAWGTKVFFAHPYASWERPQNERHNGMLREYIPKSTSIAKLSDEDVLAAADEINARPRKVLEYSTPEIEFENFLDEIYSL